MSVVLNCIRWSWRAGWRETRQQPGGLLLFFVTAPVGVGFLALVGLWFGVEIADEGKAASPMILACFLALGGLVGLLSLWGEGAKYVTARGRRAGRRLSLLPLSSGQLYGINFLEFASILGVFALPYSIACALPPLARGRLDLALLLFLGCWLVLGGVLAASRIGALLAMLVPPRFGGWFAALVLPIATVVVAARPFATWVQTSGPPYEEPRWAGALSAIAPIDSFAEHPITCLAVIALLTLAVVGVDFFAYERIIVGRPGLMEERAVRGGARPPWSGLARWLERLDWPRRSPLRALLRKELVWLLRDRTLYLIPLLLVVMTSLGCVALELILPVGLVFPDTSLAIVGCGVTAAVVLVLSSAVYAASSLPAEGRSMRRLLESPLDERALLHLRTLSLLPFTVLSWLVAWTICAVVFGSALGLPGWILWVVGPLAFALAAAFISFAGVAVGTLFPRRLPEHPLLAVSLFGLGVQLALAFLTIGLTLGSLAALSGGGSLTLLALGVPPLLLLAGHLRSEARRRLRTMRLVA